MDVIQFVDTVSASPTVRLNLNNEAPWATTVVDFSPPPLKQSWSGTLLADGERLSAAAYANRTLRLSLELIASQDASGAALQALWRELDRPCNLLKYQPDGATSPVFFRTLRSMDNSVRDYPGGGPTALRTVEVEIVAEPFAVGLRESLPQVTVYNDPAEGTTLNQNPFFETDAAGWSGSGGSVARSTAQAHEGVASLLLTPTGGVATSQAQTDLLPIGPGVSVRADAWVRCAVSRDIGIAINWNQAGGAFISQSFATFPVVANTWTKLTLDAVSPALTGQFRLIPASLTGTPPNTHLTFIDEARARESGGVGGMCFDVAGSAIRGDVETPLFLSIVAADVLVTGRRQSAIAVRRRGTPSAAPMVLQAETMSVDADTTLQANSSVMSGAGSNSMRVSFATAQALARRLFGSVFPATPSVDARGTYRVLARVRKSVAADVMTMRLTASYNAASFNGDVVTLPSGTEPRWVDLGQLPYPVGYDPVTDGFSGAPLAVTGAGLAVYAGRSSGSGSLDIDVLLLVPADDRYCEVKWSGTTGPAAFVLDSGANAVYGVGTAGEIAPTELMELEGLPPLVTPGQAARVVFVQDVGSTSSGGDDATRSTRITPYYWPRYMTVRPVAS